MKAPEPITPYSYQDFQQASCQLLEAFDSGCPYALVLGPSGVGKTTLLRHVHQQLDPRSFQLVYLSDSQLSRWQLIRHLAHALHLPIRYTRDELRTLVIQQIQQRLPRLILVLDDAHLLANDILHTLRQLVEVSLGDQPLFQVLFSSLPEFKERIRSPSLTALHRRLWPRIQLNGLRQEELIDFLAHLFSAEQANRFSEPTRHLLFEQTAGIPAAFERAARACIQAVPQGPITLEQTNELIDQLELV